MLLVLGMWFESESSMAQIIGEANVGNDVRTTDISLGSIEAGVSTHNLTPSSTNNSSKYKFSIDRPGLAIVVYQDNVLFSFDYSNGRLDDGKKVTFLNVGAKIDFPVILTETKGFAPQIPFSIITNFMLANGSGLSSDDQLSLSTIGVGTGLGLQYSTKRYIFVVKAEAFIAFATQSFTAESGSSNGFTANVAFQYPKVFGKIGLAISYRFNYIDTNLGDNRYDYRLKTNAITAGITF